MRVENCDGGARGRRCVPKERDRARTVRRRGEQPFRTLLVQHGQRGLHRVHVRDERREVEARRLPIPRARGDDVELAFEAELEAHRHHHAARKEGREQIAEAILGFDLGRGSAVQFRRESRGVVAFGKRDRWCDVPELLVLFEQPARAKIPPLRAVEKIVETRIAELRDFLDAAAERLCREHDRRIEVACRGDQRGPHRARHLVRRIAAKPAHAELHVVSHDGGKIRDHLRAVGSVGEVEFRKIAPHGHLARIVGIDRGRRFDRPVGRTRVPRGPLARERRVVRRMVDHEIEHRRQSARGGRRDRIAHDLVIRARVVAAQERVEAIVIAHRVEASGATRLMDRVDVDPVESHGSDAVEVRGPL